MSKRLTSSVHKCYVYNCVAFIDCLPYVVGIVMGIVFHWAPSVSDPDSLHYRD